ncbi:GntR family transcriptional regulator [uncultured Gimesia sp.]|uniref:GntR family transcriptional regulator n=1 Tax=uncultured Gimesia sp. TaxID=1678688 RepID=UPI0026388BB0|nr:GntR family transcriptional regulator [uncultured Gimesia sp.]
MQKNLSLKTKADFPLRKIQKQLISDDVEKQLREAILSGALAPGESLAEAHVGEQLGVSRASVRQAKFHLASEGLLEFDDRGTAIVRKLTLADAHEILEFRQALELAAVRLACTRLTDDAVAAIEANIRQTEQERDLLTLTHLDIAFHEEIIRAACNSRLMSAWHTLRPQLELWLAGMHRRHSAITAQTCEVTVDGHRALLAALQSGDPDHAEQAMRQHTSGMQAYFSLTSESDSDVIAEGMEKGWLPC